MLNAAIISTRLALSRNIEGRSREVVAWLVVVLVGVLVEVVVTGVVDEVGVEKSANNVTRHIPSGFARSGGSV